MREAFSALSSFLSPVTPEVFGQVIRSLEARAAAVPASTEGVRIGPYVLANRVALAPMAGVTDLPFRQLCHRLGAGLVVSEMLASNPALWDTPKSRNRRRHDVEIEPRSVQIAGGDPETVAEAARCNVGEGAQIIDINMGCPAKKVCRKAAGSALMRDESLVRAIVEATVRAVDVPVTLKMRTGWSHEMRNGVTIARIAEDAGIAALAVHGRTRADRFNGKAEFRTIAEIVTAVDLPVFANGDIDSPERAAEVIEETGAAGVMIGRAAQGRPWLCGQIARFLEDGTRLPEPDAQLRGALMRAHLSALHDFHGPVRGVRIGRKHVGWAVAACGGREADRRAFLSRFNGLEDESAQLDAVASYFESSALEAA